VTFSATWGFSGARLLLQTGNVVFESPRISGPDLECLLQKESARRLGVSIDYIVRSAKEREKILVRNPFLDEAKDDPSHLVVMCLKSAADAKKANALPLAIQGPETVRGDGMQLYIYYPAGIGSSKLTNALIERQLGIRGTARNWNTVVKLAALRE
jgi:uncharacterized protein (DUF1697 family)